MKSIIIKNFIYSKNLKHLFDKDIDQEFIPTLIFKDIEDKYKKVNIVEELCIRGFKFEPDKRIFLFEPCYCEFVFTKENEDKYKKIDFKRLGINDLVFKYSVNDDRFFNYIPLKNIINNNSDVSVDALKKHIVECGFELKEYDPEIEAIPNESYRNVNEPFVKYETGSEINIDSINPLMIYELLYSSKEPKTQNWDRGILEDFNLNLKTTRDISKSIEMLSDSYFLSLPNKVIENEINDTKLVNIINHLKNNDVILFSELTKKFLIHFSKTTGVGVRKILQLLSMIENINNDLQGLYTLDFKENGEYRSITAVKVKFSELYYNQKHIHLRNHYLSFDLREGNFDIAFLNAMADIISKYKKLQGLDLDSHTCLLQNYQLFNRQRDRLKSGYISEKLLKKEVLIDKESNEMDILFNTLNDFGKFERFIKCNLNFDFHQRVDEREMMTLDELLQTFIDSQKSESMSIYVERQKGFTLESIARKVNVTRERVRQIEAKVNRNCAKFYESNRSYIIKHFNDICEHYQTEIIRDEYLELEENMIHILKGMIKNSESKILSKYIDKVTMSVNFDATIDEIIDNIDSSYISHENLFSIFNHNFLDLGLKTLTKEDIFTILDYKKIRYDESNVFFNRVTKSDKYAEVIKLYDKQVNLVNDFEDFSEKFYKLFNERLSNTENSIRSIAARLYDSKNVYITGTNNFIHVDNIRFNNDQIDFLLKKIESSLSIKSRVKIGELFKEDRENFELNGYFNEYIAYSIAKVHGSSLYEFGKGNTMMISKSKDDLQKDYHDEIYQLVADVGGSLDQNVIIDHTGIFFSNLDGIIEQKGLMIRISSTIYTIEKLNCYREEFELILAITNELINRDEITTHNEVFERCLFNEKIYTMFQEMEINESINFYSLLRYLAPEYANGTSNILKSSNHINNDIWLYFANKVKRFTVDYLVNYLQDKGFSRVTIDAKRKELQIREEFIRLDFDSYAINEVVGINKEVIESLTNYVTIKFTKEYIVINSLYDYGRYLPTINASWTPYLIHELLKRQGFRSIEKQKSTNIDRLIIVKNDSKIKNFEDLVYYVLTQRLPEEESNNLLSYIRTCQILPSSVDALPKEILDYEWLLINGTGEYHIDHEKFKEHSV